MKNISLALLLGGALIAFPSCKKKKAAAEAAKPPVGEVEVKMYCSGPDYFTDKNYFRANSVGESLDQATATKKARANAKLQLAGDINTTMKATIDNYVKSSELNNTEQVLENFEGLSREVIDQELQGVKTICEKMTQTSEGKYKSYVAIELSGDKLVGKYNERLTNNEQLLIDYNYEKFKETFEKEMEKMGN